MKAEGTHIINESTRQKESQQEGCGNRQGGRKSQTEGPGEKGLAGVVLRLEPKRWEFGKARRGSPD